MKELVVILEDLGARKVKTYIQSGNAVFVCKDKKASQLSNQIRIEIKKRRGFDPYVLLFGLKTLKWLFGRIRSLKQKPTQQLCMRAFLPKPRSAPT